jgi:outer membrane protein TolC
MKKYFVPCALLLLFINSVVYGQTEANKKRYSLEEIITISKKQSPISLQATNRKENFYWRYRTFLSDYKPQLSLSGNLPNYNKSIERITLDDGSDVFIDRGLVNTDVSLSLRQRVGLTGGEVFLNSELARIDLLGNNTGTSFLSTPISIGFRQPLFGFNELKWNKKIEPLRYSESQKAYSEEMENIAVQTTDLFFNLLVAQITLKISEVNKANNDTIYRIGQGRYNVGKIAENELLQLQLSAMSSDQSVTQAKMDIETSELRLKIFLGNNETLKDIELIEPLKVPDVDIDEATALAEAKKNRARYVQFKRQKLEAERDVAQARGNSGLNVNITGSYGFTRNAPDFTNVYENPQNQQRFRIGFQIPILDWGRQKALIQTAVANNKLVQSTVTQEELNFEQEIILKVKQFKIFRSRLILARRADEIAQRRYEVAQKRYLIAKINITDLNIALQDKDRAKRDYLEALRSFWKNYYEIRKLTLYDFEKNEVIYYGDAKD